MAGGFGFWLRGWDPRSVQSGPRWVQPERRRTRRGSRIGLCVKGRWGGKARRPAGGPGSLPSPPAAPPSPRSLSAAAARAGRARGRLRHTLTHTHTRAASRALSEAHTGAGESLGASLPGSDPSATTRARLWQAAPLQTAPSRPPSQPPGPHPVGCGSCRTWKRQQERVRHANGNGTLPAQRARLR